jgi:hypothetical protein
MDVIVNESTKKLKAGAKILYTFMVEILKRRDITAQVSHRRYLQGKSQILNNEIE